MALTTGTRLGSYEIVALLAQKGARVPLFAVLLLADGDLEHRRGGAFPCGHRLRDGNNLLSFSDADAPLLADTAPASQESESDEQRRARLTARIGPSSNGSRKPLIND